MPLMQTISHPTRAYIVNSDGLPGFLLGHEIKDIIKPLKAADEAGKLEHAKKWQVIDLVKVEQELEK